MQKALVAASLLLQSQSFASASLAEAGTCSDADCLGEDVSSFLQVHRFGGGAAATGARALQAADASRFDACHLENSTCALAGMAVGRATLVYPGGDTGCISGGAYAFSVLKGDTNKLAFMFQGGGACWEANGGFGKQVVMMCTESMDDALSQLADGIGIQNTTNEANPFKGYTIVQNLYCSGDAHMGNTSMTDGENTYVQRGYANTVAVKKWMHANFPGELESFVVTGYSAGTLGTMGWAGTLLSDFTYKSAAVLMDSYCGSFPGATQAATMERWGTCDVPLWTGDLAAKCTDHTITIQAALEDAMRKFPNVAFGSLQSKTDGYQIVFYEGMAKSWGMIDEMSCPGEKLYKACNGIFEGFAAFPNYAVYLIDGSHHCFTNFDLFYSASTDGPETSAEAANATSVHQWVRELLDHKPCASQCHGQPHAGADTAASECDEDLLKGISLTVAPS